jgi:crotonobetainyl-CoA:carnitine CoA-transferase CaiB-like acyl-CoA transferase
MPELDKLPIKSFQPDARGPLHGVRVLDLSRLVAGNILTLALADFGADVVKVEPPQGDPLRAWLSDGVDTHWKVYGRNKKSVCLDLRAAKGKDVLLAMVRNAHVLVENYRPDTLEKMGLAPDVLHAANAGLVVVRISGWGQTGPFRHKPGFGTLVEGFSGYASMNGFPDREPVLPPIQMADNVAGLAGAFATMVALREVEVNGGRGQTVDLPLFDPLFATLGPQAAHYQLTGRVKQRTGSRSTTAGPRNVFRTRDDHWICLSASTQVMAERLFRVIGREDLIGHPDYATNGARVRNAAALEAIIGGFMGERTLEENLHFFDAADVTVGPVNDISQIVEDPYIVAREILVRTPDKDLGNIAMHNIGPRLSGTPGALRHAAPELGQHNREVLASAGIDDARYEALLAAGITREGTPGLEER